MSQVVVLDTSVAMSWVLPDELSDVTKSLKSHAESPGVNLVVPPIFWPEVENVLVMAVRRFRIDAEWAEAALDALIAFDITEYDVAPAQVLRGALADHLSAYDTQYLALARETSGSLWTVDQRLAQSARVRGIRVEPATAPL